MTKSSGLVQPIIVRKFEQGYQLVAGERRLRAAKIAGLASIPAIVRDVDSFTQAQMALAIPGASVHRVDDGHLLCAKPTFAAPLVRACLDVAERRTPSPR